MNLKNREIIAKLKDKRGCDVKPSGAIIEALDRVVQNASESKLSEEIWMENDEDLSFLSEELNLTKEEVLIIGVMCEFGQPVLWKQLAEFFGITQLQMMSFNPVMESLKQKRWIRACEAYDGHGYGPGFKLVRGVMTAIRENRPFQPERIEGLTEQEFVEWLGRFMSKEANDLETADKNRLLIQLVDANPELPICKVVSNLEEESSKIILLMVVGYILRSAEYGQSGIILGMISIWFEEYENADDILESLRNATNELFRKNLIRFRMGYDYEDRNIICLTTEARRRYLPNFIPKFDVEKMRMVDVVEHDSIEQKRLFFNKEDLSQLDCLGSLFTIKSFSRFRKMLLKSVKNRGVSCLLYGKEGSGKTEAVLQLARETGRTVMKVDVETMRRDFPDDREGILISAFRHFRHLCELSDVRHVFLLKGAERLFHTSSSLTPEQEKENENIRRILKQGIEEQRVILVVTSNLTTGLDAKLDDQFGLKMTLSCPGPAERRKIWQSVRPYLTPEECTVLAEEFEFNGGEIERAVRKGKLGERLWGIQMNLEELRDCCLELLSETD